MPSLCEYLTVESLASLIPIQFAFPSMSEQETARCFYTAMRSEINQHMVIVNQIFTLYLGGITVLFAGSLHRDGNHNLLLLIPFLSLGAANMLGSHERAIGSIAAYCVQDLDSILNKNGEPVVQWDRSRMLKRYKDGYYASNRAGGLTLIVFPGIAALFLNAYLRNNSGIHSVSWVKIVAWCVSILCLARAGWVIIQTARYRKKLDDSYNQPTLDQQPQSAIIRFFSSLRLF